MSWADVAANIKFWGPDGLPATINGKSVENDYDNSIAFTSTQKRDILSDLQALYEGSTTASDARQQPGGNSAHHSGGPATPSA